MRLNLLVAVLCCLVLSAGSAFAAPAPKSTSSTVFPPAGCSETEKMVMTWQKNGASTECLTATQVIDLAIPDCQPGQLLVKAKTGYTCVALPACKTDEVLSFNGRAFVCSSIEGENIMEGVDCPPPFALSYHSGKFLCVVRSYAGLVCPSGQFLTGYYRDGTLACATPDNPTPPAEKKPTTYPGGCVDRTCEGKNNVIFPVANTKFVNPDGSIGISNRYPVKCEGNWKIWTYNTDDLTGKSHHWESSCDTMWEVGGNCNKPEGGDFPNCPNLSGGTDWP